MARPRVARPGPGGGTAAPGRAPRGGRAGHPPTEVPRVAIVAVAAWAALLALAPPADNFFWGVNAFRSLPDGTRWTLLLVAAAAPFLTRVRSRGLAVVLAIALAILVAFPLRERIHFLGDTQVRLRAMAIFTADMISVSLAEWSTRLHANPIDILVDFLAPIGLRRLGLPLTQGISVVSAALALAFLAGLWRVTGRLGLPAGMRVASCAAIACSGVMQAFAGYAESAGLLLASAAWWWAAMLAPLDGRRAAARLAAAWLAVALSHRLGLVLLLPLAWRGLGPAPEGDRPEARRALLGFGALAVLVTAAAMAAGGGGRQLGMDLGDMAGALTTMSRTVPVSDYLNTLALVAPLAVLAPWFAGRAALGAFVRSAPAAPLLVASLVLLPLLWMVPANAHGLGAHRDWDLGVLGGLTLSITALALLARLPAGRLRGALLCALPLLALHAGGWVLVNASEAATLRRARALVERPPGLAEPHLANLHGYLGQRAMDVGAPRFAAPELERAFDLNRNPRRAMLAAEAWALAGDLARARAVIARGRAAGPLSPTVEASALRLEALIARMTADSARSAPAPPPPGAP